MGQIVSRAEASGCAGCRISGQGNVNPILIWPRLACSDGVIIPIDPAPAAEDAKL